MADIEDFMQQNNAEVELHELLDNPPDTPTLEERSLDHSRPSSQASSASSSSTKLQQLQSEIESLKEKLRCQEEEMQSEEPPTKRKKGNNQQSFAMLLPPPTGHHTVEDETGQGTSHNTQNQSQRTVLGLLHHLTTLMTIRMDDYAVAYRQLLDIQNTKVPQVVCKTLSELMTVWSTGLTTEPGNSSCIEFLIRWISPSLSTRSLGTTTWGHLVKFLQKCGIPGASVVKDIGASLQSVCTTNTMCPTTMSSMTVPGPTILADVEGSRDGVHGLNRVRPVKPEMYIPRTYEDLQSTSAREGDDRYIEVCGDDWWTFSQDGGIPVPGHQGTTTDGLVDSCPVPWDDNDGSSYDTGGPPSGPDGDGTGVAPEDQIHQVVQSRGKWRKS